LKKKKRLHFPVKSDGGESYRDKEKQGHGKRFGAAKEKSPSLSTTEGRIRTTLIALGD